MYNFKKLAALLICYQHNVRMLHWKVKGVDFDEAHELLGDYYDKMSVFLDDVSELGMMVGEDPICITEAFKILMDDNELKCIELQGNECFTSREAFEKIGFMFDQLIDLYDVFNKDTTLPISIINTLQEQQHWFRKECHYKNRRRV